MAPDRWQQVLDIIRYCVIVAMQRGQCLCCAEQRVGSARAGTKREIGMVAGCLGQAHQI